MVYLAVMQVPVKVKSTLLVLIGTKSTYSFYFFCFYFFKIYYYYYFKLIYLIIFGCVGSSFLWEGFLQLWQAGATLHRGARASHYRRLSCCRAQAPDAQAQ